MNKSRDYGGNNGSRSYLMIPYVECKANVSFGSKDELPEASNSLVRNGSKELKTRNELFSQARDPNTYLRTL